MTKPLDLWTQMFRWYGYNEEHAKLSAKFALRLLNKPVEKMRKSEMLMTKQHRNLLFFYLQNLGVDKLPEGCYNGSIPGEKPESTD